MPQLCECVCRIQYPLAVHSVQPRLYIRTYVRTSCVLGYEMPSGGFYDRGRKSGRGTLSARPYPRRVADSSLSLPVSRVLFLSLRIAPRRVADWSPKIDAPRRYENTRVLQCVQIKLK